MNDDSGMVTTFPLVDESAVHGIVAEALRAPGRQAGEEVAAGACGPTGDAGRGREGKLSHYTKRQITTQATAAARENRSPRDECPYRPDYAPEAFELWRAVFIYEGGTW